MYNTFSDSINEIIMKILLSKYLTNSELSSIQRKLSHLFGEYKYSKIKYLDVINFDYACRCGYDNIVKYLVEHGADVQRNKDALIEACKNRPGGVNKYLTDIWEKVEGNENSSIKK